MGGDASVMPAECGAVRRAYGQRRRYGNRGDHQPGTALQPRRSRSRVCAANLGHRKVIARGDAAQSLAPAHHVGQKVDPLRMPGSFS